MGEMKPLRCTNILTAVAGEPFVFLDRSKCSWTRNKSESSWINCDYANVAVTARYGYLSVKIRPLLNKKQHSSSYSKNFIPFTEAKCYIYPTPEPTTFSSRRFRKLTVENYFNIMPSTSRSCWWFLIIRSSNQNILCIS